MKPLAMGPARLLALALSLHCAGTAAADAYPAKPVTLIVPQAPGGANDTIARIYAAKMSTLLGQPFIVDNRPGAGGNIGTVAAARARPDGYTLILNLSTTQVVNPALYAHAGFDPIKDFQPVTMLASAAYLLVANAGFAPSSVTALIAQAKAQPGQLAYASAGNGTLNHLLGEMLKARAGIDMVHVPYKGAAAAVTDVVGGRVPVSFQSAPSAMPFVKSGKLKVLGVANEKRMGSQPHIPTIGESLPGFGATPWYGVFAPAATPPEVVATLHAASAKALASPDVQAQLAQQGAEPIGMGPAPFAAALKNDVARWSAVVRETGSKID
jgi:tripartite-type tricarboxylate transporter receptor subunit TctC